ncbi:MAG TPA: hypothetical protein VMV25_13445 [Steroidobacteraceae bacterium]|nr:hypothetical protein [Steroidobacteraceae bacterium]
MKVIFKDENNVAAGGQVLGDYGWQLCRWKFSLTTRRVEVYRGAIGKSVEIPRDANLGGNQLKRRVASLVIDLTRRMIGRD